MARRNDPLYREMVDDVMELGGFGKRTQGPGKPKKKPDPKAKPDPMKKLEAQIDSAQAANRRKGARATDADLAGENALIERHMRGGKTFDQAHGRKRPR